MIDRIELWQYFFFIPHKQRNSLRILYNLDKALNKVKEKLSHRSD